jgi:hypothetical protein
VRRFNAAFFCCRRPATPKKTAMNRRTPKRFWSAAFQRRFLLPPPPGHAKENGDESPYSKTSTGNAPFRTPVEKLGLLA